NEHPDLVILIDYPGFNIRLAEKLKGKNTKILYYILPQVWAWGKGRIEKMAYLTDAMASIIPFEPEIFNKFGGNCTYIGHPLIHRIESYTFNHDLIKRLRNREGKNILILPGSRMNEIEKIFPVMVQTAEIINSKMQDEKVTFYISVAETIDKAEISKRLKGVNFKFKLFTENLYEHLKSADFAVVTSGTATLETALFNLPMVLLYKTSGLTYSLAKLLVKVDNIGLVNIISGKKIVNEYIQSLDPSVIADEIIQLIQAPEKLEAIKRELLKVQNKLGKKNASENGAKMLISMLG
ncbi:lipid-A-disaccharide synthase, partial [Candidatus Dependentiae bacterium]|nr:lipid-A-disaccharide synthase [Candidatus Dependentiae bacterium]